MISVEGKSGRIGITMTAQRLGPDLNLSLFGGEAPHIGAVALAQPRASLKGDGSPSASCSVLTLCGHKEDELARALALELATRLGCNVCVACGIHQDDILQEEIRGVLAEVEGMKTRLLEQLLQAS